MSFQRNEKKMFIYGTWGHLEVVKFVFENTNCTVLQNWKNNAINKYNYHGITMIITVLVAREGQ